jgi:ABC-type transport system involved in multi-copper enzyme maturation permease subunit
MKNILTIAYAEIKSLLREKIIYSITIVFILMSMASSFIGWSTFTTANAVYKSSVVFLQNQGVVDIPSNPLLKVPTLASFDNLIIYISLIGTLLAIIIGHRSMMRERKSGILQILFTRPITKKSVILGKVLGLSATIFSIVGVTALISILSSYFLPLAHLSIYDISHLLVFFLTSFFYMLFFALVGLFFAINAKSESLALFIPVCIWVGITFVLPELATGLTPTALLNPVTLLQLPVLDSFFQTSEKLLAPFSLAWHYYTISGELLGSSFAHNLPILKVVSKNSIQILTMLGSIIALLFLSIRSLHKFDTRADFINE